MEPTVEYWPLIAAVLLTVAMGAALWLFNGQVARDKDDVDERMERALASARKAAGKLSKAEGTHRWARAQMQLAMLLTRVGGHVCDVNKLGEALEILAATIPVLETKGMTGERATALYYRGRAEWEIAMREPDGARLEAAVETFRHLLEHKPWPRHLLRSVVMTLPGVILVDLGQRRNNRAMIEEGAALCREAATAARRRIAVEWCIAYRNLCHSLTILGRHAGDPDLLEEAVAAGQEAAGAIRPTRDPGQWIISRICLGHALCTLGELRGDADKLQEGIAVLEEIRRTNDPAMEHDSRMLVAQPLAGALIAVGRLTRDRVALRRARQELIVALKVFDRLGRYFARAEAERMTGLALASLAAIEEDPAVRREAAARYRTALDLFGAAGAIRQVDETEAALRALDEEPAANNPPGLPFTPFYVVR